MNFTDPKKSPIFRIAEVDAMRTFSILVAALALAAGALSASASAAQAAPLTETDVSAWLDSYLLPAMHAGDIAGAAVVVVKDGKVLVERGYGMSDVVKRTPVDPRLTLFRVGSVSKLFTWTAVMQLVEQGRIDLDTDINQYLDFKIPPRSGNPITMRNLMQHTAGFEDVYRHLLIDDPQVQTYESWLKSWTPQRIFPAGTTPAYSNYGGTLAGYIVQRVSGEPFDDYIEKHIFQPLDMQHSTFREPLPAALAPFMSQGYATASLPPHKFELVGPVPVGALTSSADDMAHFMIAHLQDGEYMGNPILRRQTAQLMHNSPLYVLPGIDRLELGFYETNINGREVIGHTGDTSWFHSALHLFLKEGVGLFFSFNSQGRSGAVGPLRTALFNAFADRYFPGSAETQRVDATTAAAHARLVTGYWITSRRSQSKFPAAIWEIVPGAQPRVTLNAKGELVYSGLEPDAKPVHLIETSPFVWTDAAAHVRVGAKIADGRAVILGSDHSPAEVLLRPQWYQNAAWELPAINVSECALLLTALCWPIVALMRRLHGTPLNLDARSYQSYRWSKIGAIAILAALPLWGMTLNQVLSFGVSDSQVRIAQCFGLVAFVGGAGLMLWNVRTVWSGVRRWPARVWSIVLALSALVMLWFASAFGLIGFSLNY
ncbi:MAG TPA: serine hydrolase domain-containing protein [Steroidobacteraceae bacterium]